MKSRRHLSRERLWHYAMGASLGAFLVALVFAGDFGHVFRMIHAALFMAASATASHACPDLSGIYACPAHGNQTPLKLFITNSHYANGSTTYKFRYIRSRVSIWERVASREGIKMKDGARNSCTDKEYIINETRNFINAAGDYETTINGKTQMICVRQK
jgi:hypothetical protein